MTALDQPVGWFVPGRIEVLGKHTDYAGGHSLLAAVDRGITATVLPAAEGITAHTAALPGEVSITAGQSNDLPQGHWGNYLQTVVDRLTQNFGAVAPMQVSVDSNLPLASGMSSSSALVVGLALAIAEFNGFIESDTWRDAISSPEDLAGYLACIENGMSFGPLAGHRGVGTFGGSEDHTAMICSAPASLGLFSFAPIRREKVLPFPDELSFVVAVSGVAAEKTGAARELYNRAAFGVRDILERWNQQPEVAPQPSLAAALRSGPEAIERAQQLVSDDSWLSRRLAHFLAESERIIPAAAQAFERGDWDGFGTVVDESQQQASQTLGNQVPQTEFLAEQARSLGALASCNFGAGFGGSVWALVPAGDADGFGQAWLERYRVQFPEVAPLASVMTTRPSGPVRPLD